MTDSEIVTALTVCHKDDDYPKCDRCPYIKVSRCMDILGEDALGLIHRQQAELEKAKSEAVMEFAEKLKRKSELVAPSVWAIPYRAVAVTDIDKLVEGMECSK